MALARPVVSVFGTDGKKSKNSMGLPCVFSAPLKADLVQYVHRNMNKNKRQAMGLKDESGYDTAAISWGTGRAVARIPRVPGGGTHRSGQAAFGNMCRGGGMFNPTKTWRRWHRKTNVTQKRHAVAAAVAASAVPALVMARGHKVDQVAELPLVVSDAANEISKTKEAVAFLNTLGCAAELEKVAASKKIRCGKGKSRNRRYVMRKGPLIVHAMEADKMASGPSLVKSFRNIPGVDICHVDRLNLLQLAPGGQFGRFVIYTESAVKKLAGLYGTFKSGSSSKKGYTLPRPIMKNTDVARIINSNEIQSALKPALSQKFIAPRQRKNPLKNKSILGRVSAWGLTQKKVAKLAQTKGTKANAAVLKGKAKKAAQQKKNQNKGWMKGVLATHRYLRVTPDKPAPGEPVAEEE